MIRPDVWIERMAREHGMIDPFEDRQVREVDGKKIISYGLSSYGYDLRLARDFKVFTDVNGAVVDPKAFDPSCFVEKEAEVCLIPPHSFVLGRAVEHLRVPRNVTAIVLGKSTYARCGIVVNCTPAEAGWEGHLTIEISNTSPLPARVYAGEGICQCLFFEGDLPCRTSYADRNGKYNKQAAEVTLPRV